MTSTVDADWQRTCQLLIPPREQELVPSDRLVFLSIVRAPQPTENNTVLRLLLADEPASRLYSTRGSFCVTQAWSSNTDDGPDLQVSQLVRSIVWRRPYTLTLPKLLLEIGATPHLADSRGRTPLHACVFMELPGIACHVPGQSGQLCDELMVHDTPPSLSHCGASAEGRLARCLR
jgi:hypothetical protein